MEHELYRSLYKLSFSLGRSRLTKYVIYPDWKVVVVYFWAVIHDRPVCWACCARNWPVAAKPLHLPTPSTMCRRLRRQGIISLIHEMEQKLRKQHASDEPLRFIDAKPLPVGSGSKDPDAKAGFAGSGIARGFKLHAMCDIQRIPIAWTVYPMNTSETKAAPELIMSLTGKGTLVGDTAYDHNHLYDLAGECGWQLYASRKRGKNLGHRRHSPWRIAAQLKYSQAWRDRLRKKRLTVERFFAHLTSFSSGLSPLPSWVRSLRRVRQWVQAKIIIYLTAISIRAKLQA